MLHKQMILFLALLFSLIKTSSAQADIILKYDFENKSYEGIRRQYQTKICSQDKSYIDNSLFQIVKDKTRPDNYVLKHHIKNCDERSEIAIPSGFFKKGQEYWIGWSYFFPKDFIKPVPGEDTYTIINQMMYNKAWLDQDQGKTLFECHATTSRRGVYKSIGSPGSEMIISPKGDHFTYKMKFYKGIDSQGRAIFGCENFQIPATLERWEDFVMNVKFSDNPKEGFLKLWKNGELYIDKKLTLLRPGAEVGSWKIGAYVGDPGHGERIVYTDELKVGDKSSSLNEVSSKKLSFLDKTIIKLFSFF